MDSNHQKEIAALRNTIEVLEAENAHLSERAEEALLVGLVAETIQSLTDPAEIVENVLERVSILKNIPYTACGRLMGHKLEPIAAYASFSDKTDVGWPIQINDTLLDEISQGPYVTTNPTELSADFEDTPFHPAVTAVIPFKSQFFSKGLFLFMDGDGIANRLAPMLFMLDRIVEMTVSRIDNQYLMRELARLNKELESRIDERTRALVTANQKLKAEIAERKQSELALKNAHERFVTVLDGIDAHVYASDLRSYEILFMNRKMKEDFGPALVGKRCYREFRNEMSPCKICTNSRLLDEHGKPGQVITWESKSPITGNWYMNHDRAVTWVDGRLVKLQIAIDITELKRVEHEKEQLQARFQQSQKMEAIGTLAGGIAHDFNNLLMGIQGRTSLVLLDLPASDAHHEHLKSIEAYVQSAAGLTKQLLGFARGGKYEPKPTDLNRIADESAKLFGRTKKEIRIHKKLAPELWTVDVDRGQIQQVLLNLYVNAWQAMPDGGDLYIQTQNQALTEYKAGLHQLEPGRYVSIKVSDTGIGMDPSILSRIFDPFFTTKEKGRGTGLGLASSYGIIQNHGGAIEAASETGSGSTFTIYLPASKRTVAKEPHVSQKPAQGSGTILLVDDELMIIDVGKMMLERLGYSVDVATSGSEAIKKYTEKRTDIVILDMIMPDMSGGEVFDRLKAVNPDVRVVLSSGYSLSGQTQEVFDRGCHGFIQKPFTLDALSEKVQMVMHKA